MDDFMKKVPTNKTVSGHMKQHLRHTPMQYSSGPYSAAEMRKAMDCSNGTQGLGMGKVESASMPKYNVFGETISVTHGHREVKGSKI